MTQTRQELRIAWNKKTYKSYMVNVRKKEEKDIVDYVEKRKKNGEQTSAIFKDAIRKVMEKEK